MFGALSAAAFFKLSYTFPFQQLSGLVSSPRSARSLTPTDALPCTARVSTPRATSTPSPLPAPRLTRVDPLDAFYSSSNASFSQRRTSVSRTPRPDQSPAPASPRSPPRVARHRPSTQVSESGLAVTSTWYTVVLGASNNYATFTRCHFAVLNLRNYPILFDYEVRDRVFACF